MPNPPRFELGSGLPAMPNLGGFGKRILQLAIVLLAFIFIMASTTSIPTGNVGVLTLFGRVTGETLPEGIHLVNPLKSVQKLSIQTQAVKESANVPSNEGLILALDTSLLFHLDKNMAAQVNPRCARRSAHPLPRTRQTPSTPTRASSCSNRFRTSWPNSSLPAE